jgi:ribosomal protein S27AE
MLGLLGLPTVTAIAIVVRLVGVGSAAAFDVPAILWCMWWGWVAFRAVRVPCPRCGVAFLSNQEPWERRCGRCGLILYADV